MDSPTDTDVGLHRRPVPIDVIVTRNGPNGTISNGIIGDDDSNDEFKEARFG